MKIHNIFRYYLAVPMIGANAAPSESCLIRNLSAGPECAGETAVGCCLMLLFLLLKWCANRFNLPVDYNLALALAILRLII